jgi:hypothetical protein
VVRLEGSDDKHVAVVSGNRLAKSSSPHPVLSLWISFESVEIPLQVSESIWIAVSKINSVLVMFKLASPGQGVVVSLVFTFHAVLVIADIRASSNPTSASLLCLRLRIHKWTHPVIVERIRLYEVYDIESVILSSFCIANREVIPLRISSRVIVRFQNQIIFVLVNLNRTSQVTALKP